MGFRTLAVRSSSINADDRSIEADVSTENPVDMPDFARGEMVPEILVTSGAILPESRQVPFLDSHQRASVANQLGSARGLAISDDNKLTARLHFSSAADGEFTKVREGHVTDVSAGYQILKKQYVPRGETKKIEGREYAGPANVVTSWRLMEVSLTPIGADSMAKLRGLDPSTVRFLSPDEEGDFMIIDKLREAAVKRGMSVSLTDAEAQAWIADNMGQGEKAEPEMTEEEKKKKAEEEAAASEGTKSLPADLDSRMERMVKAAFDQQHAKRSAFIREVDSLCELADVPEEAEACRNLSDIAAVRKHITDAKAKRSENPIPFRVGIRQISSGTENLIRDMKTALTMRAVQSQAKSEKTVEKVLPVAERGKGHATFQYATPYQMAEEFVRAMGIDTRGLTRETVAICAMFGPETAGLEQRDAAYHVTGNFANLTLDAMNKSMRVGYEETPQTWKGPIRQGLSVPDFKNIHRLQLSGIGNVPVWNDNADPEKATLSDSKETYAVEARSLEISYSYKLLVNDDMGQLSRTPALLGAAMARTVNAYAWSIITSNPTLAFDGKAMFLETPAGNRFRKNLTTGAAVPTVTTLGAMTTLMRLMRGQNNVENGTHAEGKDILNLTPTYIIGPAELEVTINQLVNSAYDPAATLMQVYNPSRVLTPVIEPLLSAASAKAWYLASNQIDGVEVSFMQGQENPITRNYLDPKKLSQSVTILQTFGGAALDFRGWQKHAGE